MLFSVTGTRFVWVHAADEREALEIAAVEHKLTDCTAKLVKYTTPPVILDINSLDPLERQGDDSRDCQRDYEDERREGWAVP